MSFTRKIENFDCLYCGKRVAGNGYTNHCPHCLWSKHVDICPGDRAEICGGPMSPIRIEGATPNYAIIHKCGLCGMERKVRVSKDDSIDAVVQISYTRCPI